MRIGILGGTFDPIHIGHLAAAEDTAHDLGLDQVLIVPNNIPPHKQGDTVTPAEHRVAMAELAVKDNPRFRLSLIELERDGPSYTLHTMRQLREQFCLLENDSAELVFLTGRDSLRDFHTWHQPAQLLQEFSIAIMDRPLSEPIDWQEVEKRFPAIRARTIVVHIAQLDISSREIRDRVRTGRPIRYFVPPDVEKYIRAHDLYVGTTTGRSPRGK